MQADQWFMRRLRERLGLTQQDIASAAITQGRVSQLERGDGDPPTDAEIGELLRPFIARAAGRGFELLILKASKSNRSATEQ